MRSCTMTSVENLCRRRSSSARNAPLSGKRKLAAIIHESAMLTAQAGAIEAATRLRKARQEAVATGDSTVPLRHPGAPPWNTPHPPPTPLSSPPPQMALVHELFNHILVRGTLTSHTARDVLMHELARGFHCRAACVDVHGGTGSFHSRRIARGQRPTSVGSACSQADFHLVHSWKLACLAINPFPLLLP